MEKKLMILKMRYYLAWCKQNQKTPTSIYLANRGYKTVNVPLVPNQEIPKDLTKILNSCIIGLVADPERLADIRRNRVAIMKDHNLKEYTSIDAIRNEVENSKKLFKKNNPNNRCNKKISRRDCRIYFKNYRN